MTDIDYKQRIAELEADTSIIYKFIDFIDGIQGRDLGGADILAWSDIESSYHMRCFAEAFEKKLSVEALKGADNGY